MNRMIKHLSWNTNKIHLELITKKLLNKKLENLERERHMIIRSNRELKSTL